MAGVAVWISVEIILVLRLGLPEVACGRHFGRRGTRPKSGRIDVCEGVAGDALLLRARVEDRRTIAQPPIVALAVQRRRIVDLEEELQQVAIADDGGVVDDFDRFGMGAVISVRRVRHVAAGVADARRSDAGQFADQILHSPEAAPSQYRAFLCRHRRSPGCLFLPKDGTRGTSDNDPRRVSRPALSAWGL